MEAAEEDRYSRRTRRTACALRSLCPEEEAFVLLILGPALPQLKRCI